MEHELRIDHPLPDDVLDAARTLYAAPAETEYWAGLETRIMAQIAAQQGQQVRSITHKTHTRRQMVGSWSRVGLAAAAAILLAIGALFVRSHTDEIRAAFNNTVKPAPTESLRVPDGALGERGGSDARDATFRDAIKH